MNIEIQIQAQVNKNGWKRIQEMDNYSKEVLCDNCFSEFVSEIGSLKDVETQSDR